ncbi:MAG: molybdopterin-dependent oxidoreductase [Methanobacterium sp.]|uniref:molybdopterin-dependent oxidoreductase n=1 Tax=Methanobacterium sp. TaxID=2164 RepID=UPI003D65CD7D|nr:molybdopterin-dependent oxidoreductase [Methanobacterium sp.]
MKTVVTACTRDCPGACSVIAHVEDGKIVKLTGNREHEFTAGFLCGSTKNYLKDRFYSSKRILYPLKKVEGEWERISWDEALDIAVEKLKEVKEKYGSTSILYYQGFGARTALRILNRRFFNLFGGVSTLYGTVCGGTGQAGQELDFGERISHDPFDHLNSKAIIIWGRNPAVTDIHLWKILKKARKNGAKIVVIDPVKTETAKRSNLHYRPIPNSDAFLAMGLSKILFREGFADFDFIDNHTENFEEYKKIIDGFDISHIADKCGISVNELEELASIYVNGPSSIILGWGLHRYIKGHQTFRMIDAVAAVSGNIGISGGGVSQGFEEFGYFNNSLEGAELAEEVRKLPMPTIGEAILKAENPSIKLIFISAGNPVAMNPNSKKVKKAFESTDYMIAVDQILNDTTELADLFLPATTFLEDEDILGSYGSNWITPINPVIEPLGEAKSELWIFQQLAQRLGFRDEMAGTPKEWLSKLTSPIINEGILLEELQKAPIRVQSAPKTPYADKKFKTPSGKFEFINDFEYKDGSNHEFPLRLLSIMPKKWILSGIPENEHKKGILEVHAHPDILKAQNISSGDEVLLESAVGSLIAKVIEDEEVRKDYVLTYLGGWLKYNKCVNILTKDMISERGNGTPYNETFVRIKKLE